jgi:hypothetical protein
VSAEGVHGHGGYQVIAPLTLAEVREIAEEKRMGYWKSRDIGPLCATIEWLAAQYRDDLQDCALDVAGSEYCNGCCNQELCEWLRGEA